MFAAIAALPSTAGKLYDPVTDLPAANRTGAALFDFNHTASQTITDGKVAQINDRFGNGFYAEQSTADSRPESSANVIGGLTTGYLDGNNDFLDATASMANVARNVGELSMYVTAKNEGNASPATLTFFASGSGGNRVTLFYTPTNITGNVRRLDADGIVSLASATAVTGTTNLVAGEFNVGIGATKSFVNGIGFTGGSTTAGSFSNTESTIVSFGSVNAVYGQYKGNIADILVTPSILADLDRIDYEGWQAQRGYQGPRRNLLSGSENLSIPAWSLINGATQTANTVTNLTNVNSGIRQPVTWSGDHVASLVLSGDGTVTADSQGGSISQFSLTSTPTKYTLTINGSGIALRILRYPSDTATWFKLHSAQFEEGATPTEYQPIGAEYTNLPANLPATHRYRYQHPRTRTPK
jgi:hypothetical protein